MRRAWLVNCPCPSRATNHINNQLLPDDSEATHETELKSVEKARQAALEVAQEEDAKTKARPEIAQALNKLPLPDGVCRRAARNVCATANGGGVG
jgi:hypothetical protein